MELKISGLKCDHCKYRDNTVLYSDYKHNIGRPCPSCGHSLLTQEDFDKCERLVKNFERLKKILNILKWINPFHYWRLVFGDKREIKSTTFDFKKNE